jgi:hypothetical protein
VAEDGAEGFCNCNASDSNAMDKRVAPLLGRQIKFRVIFALVAPW